MCVYHDLCDWYTYLNVRSFCRNTQEMHSVSAGVQGGPDWISSLPKITLDLELPWGNPAPPSYSCAFPLPLLWGVDG